jgi:hypothetical protein
MERKGTEDPSLEAQIRNFHKDKKALQEDKGSLQEQNKLQEEDLVSQRWEIIHLSKRVKDVEMQSGLERKPFVATLRVEEPPFEQCLVMGPKMRPRSGRRG